MNPRVATRRVALLLVFAFCQVIGTLCVLPDLSVAEKTAILVNEGMVCPMEGMGMCPPLLVSSPERQIKESMVIDVDHVPILHSPAALLAASSAPTLWSGSSVLSIVPISIGSSSVLRI